MTATITIPSRRHGDRVFWRIGSRLHQRRDGSMITLAIWQSSCVLCGDRFEVTTTERASGQANEFGVVHCLAHRRGRCEEEERRRHEICASATPSLHRESRAGLVTTR